MSILLDGLSLGAIYALIALGYTMVYGIAKLLNFAHGDIIMVGAYAILVMLNVTGNPWLGILVSVLVCTLAGIVIERLAYRPLRGASPLAVLITAIGVSYFLQNAALLLWSSNPKVFPSFFVSGSGDTGSPFSFIKYSCYRVFLSCVYSDCPIVINYVYF